MLIYSKTIISFIKRLKSDFREIINQELGIKIYRTRFFYKGRMVPYDIVVFENNTKLGYFEPNFFRIAINRKLMYLAKDQVIRDILRHELMHFIAWLDYGNMALNHLDYFKLTCKRFNYDERVSNAYTNIELANMQITENLQNEKIVEKVKKLLKLSSSDNPHEAQLATMKANELLLNHNLELLTQSCKEKEEEIYVKRVLFGKKAMAKHQAIYEILKTFFVSPVFSYGRNIFYLEVTGTYTNTQLAEYVANYLDYELEKIYQIEKKLNPLIVKNSFMQGVGIGYTEKITTHQKQQTGSKELIALKDVLKEQVEMVYQRLCHKTSRSHSCQTSLYLGKKIGNKLSINPALKKSTPILKLLSLKH